MKTTKLHLLKKQYEDACLNYVHKFCNRQDMDFEHWVGDEIGGVAACSDMFFNFSDIILDVNTQQGKGLIVDWYYECLDNENKTINYRSWIMGLRFDDLG